MTSAGLSARGDTQTAGFPRRFLPVAQLAPLGAFAVFLVFAIRAGLPVSAMATGLFAVTLTQVMPGVLVWRLVRPRDGWWTEDVVMGLAIGACLAVATQTVAGLVTASWVSLVVGPLLAGLLVLVPSWRTRIVHARTQSLPAMWGPLVAGASLLLLEFTQAFYRTVPFSWDVGFRTTYIDIPFHLALVGQLLQRGPTEMPHVMSEPLQYHWFSHAWMAQISASSGMNPDAVLLRFVPPLITVAVVCAVSIAAVRVSGWTWAGPVVALLAVAAGNLNVVNGTSTGRLVAYSSPSLAFGALVLVPLVVVLTIRWRGGAHAGLAVLVPVLAVIAAGAKGSTLPVLLAGTGLAWVASLFFPDPEVRRRIGVDLVLLTAILVFGFLAIFGGSASGLALDPAGALRSRGPARDVLAQIDTPGFLLWGTAAVLLAATVVARGIGLSALLVHRRLRHDPVTYLLLGTGLAGVAAVSMLTHPGRSQAYFLWSAAPLLAIGSAVGLAALAERLGRTGFPAVVCGVATGLGAHLIIGRLREAVFAENAVGMAAAGWGTLLVGGAVAAAVVLRWHRGSNPQSVVVTVLVVTVLTAATVPIVLEKITPSLPSNNRSLTADAPHAFSADQVDAARWLRDHSQPRALIMTNRHCQLREPERCGNRRFFVAAYTERPVLVEGWGYTPSWWADDSEPKGHRQFWDPELLMLNDGFLRAPTKEDGARLRALGVKWVYIDKTTGYSRRLSTFARPRHETEWAWILELGDGRDHDAPLSESAGS